ncbi:hypothetical protein MMC30_004244 [Trapelia coarctata]|nr:hypothetical protein [Trapelia coarctata]
MHISTFLSLTTLLPLALAASNQFSSPPPKGSGVSAATWTQGSTYTLSWSTDWTAVALYIQSSGSNPDGSPLQSYSLYEGDGSMPTSPYSFLVGDNLNLGLSPFHFEIYSPSQKKGFVSDNVNLVARSANSASASSDTQIQPTTVTVTTALSTVTVKQPTAKVTVTANPATLTTQTQPVGATITTASATSTTSGTVTLTATTIVGVSGSASGTVAVATGNVAAGSSGSSVWGVVVGLGCILGVQLLG